MRVHVHAAKHHGAGELQVLAVGTYRLFHLRRQLAGRGEHECADAGAAKAVFGAAAHGQAVQQRQGKGSGLAGTGLGATEQVVALHYQGNRLGLDGGRRFVALLAHRFEDGRCQI